MEFGGSNAPHQHLLRKTHDTAEPQTHQHRDTSDGCVAGSCPCVDEHQRALGALAAPGGDVLRLIECGPACACCRSTTTAEGRGRRGRGRRDGGGGRQRPMRQPPSCAARTTQGGVTARLAVARFPRKGGWGLVAAEALPRGAFVCEYAGEPLRAAEARRRLADEYDAAGRGHALLVARAVLPSGAAALRMSLDATARGNVARFVNHACGEAGNCSLAFVSRRGELLPRVALFASRGVAAGEELTFCYGGGAEGEAGSGGDGGVDGGGDDGGDGGGRGDGGVDGGGPRQRMSRVRCACGAARCHGWLPSEPV